MNKKAPNKSGVLLLLVGAVLAILGTVLGFQGLQEASVNGSYALQLTYWLLTSIIAGAGGFALVATYKAFAKPASNAVAG